MRGFEKGGGGAESGHRVKKKFQLFSVVWGTTPTVEGKEVR